VQIREEKKSRTRSGGIARDFSTSLTMTNQGGVVEKSSTSFQRAGSEIEERKGI